MKRLTVIVLAVVLFATAAWSAPVVPKDIAADAQWFVNIDFDAIRALPLVQDLKTKCPDHERCEVKMQKMAKNFGLESPEDFQSVTLYATQYGDKNGVALLYAKKFDTAKVIALLKQRHPDVKTADYGSRTLYTWTACHEKQTIELTGVFASDTLLVIGAHAAQVQSALDVIDAKKPALAADAPLLQGLPENTLFAARALTIPDDLGKTAHCPLLHHCKSASAIWSESHGTITGQYELTASTAETAANFKAIADGFKALGTLRVGDLPAAKKLLDGVKNEVNGNTFTATFSATTADIEAAIQALIERRKAATAPATAPAAQ